MPPQTRVSEGGREWVRWGKGLRNVVERRTLWNLIWKRCLCKWMLPPVCVYGQWQRQRQKHPQKTVLAAAEQSQDTILYDTIPSDPICSHSIRFNGRSINCYTVTVKCAPVDVCAPVCVYVWIILVGKTWERSCMQITFSRFGAHTQPHSPIKYTKTKTKKVLKWNLFRMGRATVIIKRVWERTHKAQCLPTTTLTTTATTMTVKHNTVNGLWGPEQRSQVSQCPQEQRSSRSSPRSRCCLGLSWIARLGLSRSSSWVDLSWVLCFVV